MLLPILTGSRMPCFQQPQSKQLLIEQSLFKSVASGQSVLQTEGGFIVRVFPDGRKQRLKPVEAGLWAVRLDVDQGIACVVFTVEENAMIFLHGFVKQWAKMPAADRKIAKGRLARLRGSK